MHLADCPHCGRRELRGPRAVHSIDTPKGPILGLTCRSCGAEVAAWTNPQLRNRTLELL